MRSKRFALCVVFSLAATLAQAAGLMPIDIPADANGPALRAFLWSPCSALASDLSFGPYVLPAVRDCPVAGDKLPLIVISHGRTGSPLNNHDTAEALADAGFVVAALSHPGDNFLDRSRSSDLSVFIERPTDIKRLIDFVLGASSNAMKLNPRRIGFFGFSRGGYTGLVIAGANPDFHDPDIHCPEPWPICGQIRRNEIPKQPLAHDSRVKAFVIADPLSFFPTADSLKDVKAPLQLWSSQYGGDGVEPETVKALSRNLPKMPDFHKVPNAAHFAFLAPCPPELIKAEPEMCTDAPSFDRTSFHREFNDDVIDFFRKHLTD